MHAQLKTSERASWETREDVINKYYSWHVHFLKCVNLCTKLCGSRTYASCNDFLLRFYTCTMCKISVFLIFTLPLSVSHIETRRREAPRGKLRCPWVQGNPVWLPVKVPNDLALPVLGTVLFPRQPVLCKSRSRQRTFLLRIKVTV